ncbi:hypothetical protein BD311DRAFT_751068 [Dichomitus squalens]|uniref:Uncharacterized protein n=1 Tax=Dichomitus squalens TaxID=114155 RepID=A0A4Q9MXL5_9APHY|nr:hypothetical protein BD311DRAFT_751068 [Dichomitus squalens]
MSSWMRFGPLQAALAPSHVPVDLIDRPPSHQHVSVLETSSRSSLPNSEACLSPIQPRPTQTRCASSISVPKSEDALRTNWAKRAARAYVRLSGYRPRSRRLGSRYAPSKGHPSVRDSNDTLLGSGPPLMLPLLPAAASPSPGHCSKYTRLRHSCSRNYARWW